MGHGFQILHLSTGSRVFLEGHGTCISKSANSGFICTEIITRQAIRKHFHLRLGLAAYVPF